MKKFLLIFILIFYITSCADRDAIPAAVIYTREIETTTIAEITETTTIIETEILFVEPETTAIITTTAESIPVPVAALPEIFEPDLYKSVGSIPIILNVNSNIYHTNTDCLQIDQILDENKREFGVDDLSLLSEFTACDECNTAVIENGEIEIDTDVMTVLVNLNSGTFHADLNCRHIKSMNEENKGEYTGTIDEIKSAGYKPCGTCSKQYKV